MKKVVLFPLLTCVVVALCVSYLIPLLLLSEINKEIILMLFASDCLSAALLVTLVWLVICSTIKARGGSTRSQSVSMKTQVRTHGSQMESRKTSDNELWDFIDKFQREVDTTRDINLGGKHSV